jgi:hypothetical protein
MGRLCQPGVSYIGPQIFYVLPTYQNSSGLEIRFYESHRSIDGCSKSPLLILRAATTLECERGVIVFGSVAG